MLSLSLSPHKNWKLRAMLLYAWQPRLWSSTWRLQNMAFELWKGICMYIHVYKQSTSILYASAADLIFWFFFLVKILLVTLLLFSCNLFDLSDILFSTLQVHMNLMQTSHEFLMQFFVNLMQIYEPVTEGCYIKMIDMVSDQGGQMQVSALACVTLWSTPVLISRST